MNHNIAPTDPNSSIDEDSLNVKEKRGGTHKRRVITTSLQGMALAALETRAKKLGLSYSQYVRYLIEKDLVSSGELPSWWYERRGIHR